MPRPVVLIGANGQLGSEIARAWPAHDPLVGLTHHDIEVSDPASVEETLSLLKPRLVINTSAFHKVDVVEGNPNLAFAVNSIGPRNLSEACRSLDAVLIHLSTDYVFSGSTGRAYLETDPTDPVNVYGVSKAAGEMFIRYLWPKHFIVRSSGLYGTAGPSGKGSNFVELMLRLAGEGKPIRVVNDQSLTPTPTRSLARQILALSDRNEYGTYHATCEGSCTWFEFARAIFRLSGLSPQLAWQTTEHSGAIAKRPRYSVLENGNLKRLGINCLPEWEKGLKAYLEDREWRAPSAAPSASAELRI